MVVQFSHDVDWKGERGKTLISVPLKLYVKFKRNTDKANDYLYRSVQPWSHLGGRHEGKWDKYLDGCLVKFGSEVKWIKLKKKINLKNRTISAWENDKRKNERCFDLCFMRSVSKECIESKKNQRYQHPAQLRLKGRERQDKKKPWSVPSQIQKTRLIKIWKKV